MTEVLYESPLSIFNGRLCPIRIVSHRNSADAIKIRVTSSSDASILLDGILENNEAPRIIELLKNIANARSEDPGILGPRVEVNPDGGVFAFRLIVESAGQNPICIPLSLPSPQELSEHLLIVYTKEKTEHQAQIRKTEELSKQLQRKNTELDSLKQRCEFQEKEISLLRQLSSRSDNRKRNHMDSENTPVKKRRCGCEDDGESCGSDCFAEVEEDDEEDEDIQLFRAAAAKLQSQNVEVSSGEGTSKSLKSDEFMKQLQQLSSVIVKTPNMPSTSSLSTMQIKMEDVNQERSGPLHASTDDKNVKQKVVGVVQYVICQLCPEEEQKSMDLSNQKQMEEHFLDKHVDKEKKTCEACPTDQFQPHNIGEHYRLHTNSVYACEHCGKRGRRNYLMSHIRTHTGERPYQCDTCSKSFTDSSTLRRHRLVHTGEKKYQCPVCGRAIARKDNVKVHIRSHGIHI